MNKMEKLAKSIFDKSVTRLEKIDPSTFKKIVELGREEYLYILFRDYPQIFVDFHLLGNQQLWYDLDKKSWELLIFRIRHQVIPLYTIISFLHKYTQLNALSIYEKMQDVSIEVRENVLEYFSERTGLLTMLDHEREYLIKMNIDIPA